MNEIDQIDLCCRSLYKCNAHKKSELNQVTPWGIRHCACVSSFQTCLKKLNTSLSNEVNFVHSINTTTCFAKDYPIVKCIKFEKYSDTMEQLFEIIDSDNKEKYNKRCVKYELDQNREKELQIFDVPLNENATFPTAGIQFKLIAISMRLK